MAKISANNFLSGAITSDKLETSVATNLASANSANATAVSALAAAQATYNSANTNSTSTSNLPPVISSVTITDSSWNALDDTAANTNGGYCVISGTGFVSGATVTFGTTSASAVTFSNTTSLRVQVPSLAATSYPVYVVNPNGATAIKVNGLTTSSFPVWGTAATLANTAANTAFSVSLSANSDSSITYSNTSILPAGTSLLSNGYFYGTITIGTQTTYSFDVKATDTELQDATRTFSLTVTVTPPYKLWSWGYNNLGVLGNNSNVNTSSPTQIGTGITWSVVSATYADVAAAIKSDGTLWAWGKNADGQLGQNNLIYRSSPTQVGAGTTWSKISASREGGFLAVKTDGTLWTWGYENGNGALAQNNTAKRSSPTQVGALTNWALTAGGMYAGLAVKTDGTLWVWGRGSEGQIGNNNINSTSSPIQVGAGTTWTTKTIGGGMSTHWGAIKSDGTLWMWGKNGFGQLGQNTSYSSAPVNYRNTSSPVQVAGTTWNLVSLGMTSTFAIKTDGTLWSWGQNEVGQLGKNDRTYRSSPVQIGTDTTWSSISVCYNTVVAFKTDGTLWGWGQSPIGDNTTTSRSSPIQIGSGTSWISVASGNQHAFAVGG